MALLLDTPFTNVYKMFHRVIESWLSNEFFYPIDGIKYCSDDGNMEKVALQFSEASGGVINGFFGALYG